MDGIPLPPGLSWRRYPLGNRSSCRVVPCRVRGCDLQCYCGVAAAPCYCLLASTATTSSGCFAAATATSNANANNRLR